MYRNVISQRICATSRECQDSEMPARISAVAQQLAKNWVAPVSRLTEPAPSHLYPMLALQVHLSCLLPSRLASFRAAADIFSCRFRVAQTSTA